MTSIKGIFASIEGSIISILNDFWLFFLTRLDFVSIVVGVHPVVVISLTASSSVLGGCVMLDLGLLALLISSTAHSF